MAEEEQRASSWLTCRFRQKASPVVENVCDAVCLSFSWYVDRLYHPRRREGDQPAAGARADAFNEDSGIERICCGEMTCSDRYRQKKIQERRPTSDRTKDEFASAAKVDGTTTVDGRKVVLQGNEQQVHSSKSRIPISVM